MCLVFRRDVPSHCFFRRIPSWNSQRVLSIIQLFISHCSRPIASPGNIARRVTSHSFNIHVLFYIRLALLRHSSPWTRTILALQQLADTPSSLVLAQHVLETQERGSPALPRRGRARRVARPGPARPHPQAGHALFTRISCPHPGRGNVDRQHGQYPLRRQSQGTWVARFYALAFGFSAAVPLASANCASAVAYPGADCAVSRDAPISSSAGSFFAIRAESPAACRLDAQYRKAPV